MDKKTPKRVLVAEDEGIVAEDIAMTLCGLGYEVLALAGNGDEALEMAERLKPDLILMDITMPGKLDGIEAARKVRKSLDIPVVFLTGHVDEETLDRAKGDSLFGYIIKPFARKDIRAAVELALYKHGMERALRQANAKYEAILGAIPDDIFLLSRGGAYAAMGPDGRRGVGETYPPDASARIVECVERAFAARRMAAVEYDFFVEEEQRHFEMRVVPLEGDEFLAVVRDVTDMRLALARAEHYEQRLRDRSLPRVLSGDAAHEPTDLS
jgi:CheY-like chemotaxis protein